MRTYANRDYRADLKFLSDIGIEIDPPVIVSSPIRLSEADRASLEGEMFAELVGNLAQRLQAALMIDVAGEA